MQLLVGIPGVSYRTAQVILAEIGTDMSRFPTAGHLASWAGMCPGNNESAGKHHSGRTRHGSQWLRTALIEAAKAAGRSKNTCAVGALPPHPRPPRPRQSRGRGRARDPGHRLAPAHHRRDLHRPRRRLLRAATQLDRPATTPRRPTRSTRPQSHPRTSRRVTPHIGLRPNGGPPPHPQRAHSASTTQRFTSQMPASARAQKPVECRPGSHRGNRREVAHPQAAAGGDPLPGRRNHDMRPPLAVPCPAESREVAGMGPRSAHRNRRE